MVLPLKGLPLEGAELVSIDLQGVDLSWANLTGCNLSDAQLDKADFNSADPHNAHLSEATLSGAGLSGVSFKETYPGGADRRNSDITLEGLEGAFLVGATMPDGTIAHGVLTSDWAEPKPSLNRPFICPCIYTWPIAFFFVTATWFRPRSLAW